MTAPFLLLIFLCAKKRSAGTLLVMSLFAIVSA